MGLVFIKYLNSGIGFALQVERCSRRLNSNIPGLGKWSGMNRGILINGGLVIQEKLLNRYNIRVGKSKSSLDRTDLLRLINCVKDDLLGKFGLVSHCQTLSEVCSPSQFLDLLNVSSQQAVNIEMLIQERGQFNDSLRNTLRNEIENVHDKDIDIYGITADSISGDDNFVNEFVN